MKPPSDVLMVSCFATVTGTDSKTDMHCSWNHDVAAFGVLVVMFGGYCWWNPDVVAGHVLDANIDEHCLRKHDEAVFGETVLVPCAVDC